MFTKTDMSFGVNEVLLASVLGSVVFSVFAAQPLVIVGVTGTNFSLSSRQITSPDVPTGPITVFNYTVYDIITPRGTNYFAFLCWIGLCVLRDSNVALEPKAYMQIDGLYSCTGH